MSWKRTYPALALLLLGLCLAASPAVSTKAASALKLHNTSVKQGRQVTLKLSGLDTHLYNTSSLVWRSSNKKVATISPKGIVTGKNLGKAKITVSVKGTKQQATATVSVVSYYRTKSVTMENKPKEAMLTDSRLKLKAAVSPSNARYRKIIWSSSREKVASISSKGTITAHKKGHTRITAAVKGTNKKTSFRLTVIKPVKLKKITVTGDTEVYVGSSIQLKTALSPSHTTYDKLQWKSSKTKVAAVTQNGTVKGKKAGTTTITVREKDSRKKTKYKVTVKNVPVSGINFAANNITSMEYGTRHTFTVQMAPWNATNKKLKWSTSNKTAATVDESGTVTALRPIENVDITATSADNKNLTCTWHIKITAKNGFISKSTLNNLNLTVIDKVMIVAHPDDETLWGGAHLLQDEYLVVCLTNGWNESRKNAFIETMKTTNDKYIILNYPDIRKTYSNGKYDADTLSTCKTAMQKDINTILSYKKWSQVITHNPNGEYGKYHHKTISSLVKTSFEKNCKNSELWYFGRYYNPGNIPGQQIDSGLLAIKRTMINRYYPTAKGAIIAFGHMIPYENWIRASEWR